MLEDVVQCSSVEALTRIVHCNCFKMAKGEAASLYALISSLSLSGGGWYMGWCETMETKATTASVMLIFCCYYS